MSATTLTASELALLKLLAYTGDLGFTIEHADITPTWKALVSAKALRVVEKTETEVVFKVTKKGRELADASR